MPAITKSSDVEDCLRELLTSEGYALSRKLGTGQTGVDILATKNGESYHIEVIAYKSSGSMRARDFFEAFFRTVSRLNDGARHIILALSQEWENGLPARARQHRVAWLRIGDAFPELETWIVNINTLTYRRVRWSEWAQTGATEMDHSPNSEDSEAADFWNDTKNGKKLPTFWKE